MSESGSGISHFQIVLAVFLVFVGFLVLFYIYKSIQQEKLLKEIGNNMLTPEDVVQFVTPLNRKLFSAFETRLNDFDNYVMEKLRHHGVTNGRNASNTVATPASVAASVSVPVPVQSSMQVPVPFFPTIMDEFVSIFPLLSTSQPSQPQPSQPSQPSQQSQPSQPPQPSPQSLQQTLQPPQQSQSSPVHVEQSPPQPSTSELISSVAFSTISTSSESPKSPTTEGAHETVNS
jgi:hypothetical protein